jgi:hypothetical protein
MDESESSSSSDESSESSDLDNLLFDTATAATQATTQTAVVMHLLFDIPVLCAQPRRPRNVWLSPTRAVMGHDHLPPLSQFSLLELQYLIHVLEFPLKLPISPRFNVKSIHALSILLARLGSTSRTRELAAQYLWSTSSISLICTATVLFIQRKWKHIIRGSPVRLIATAPIYAASIHAAAIASYPNCIGFVDGTDREVARPVTDQAVLYSGKSKTHVMKYQSVTTPDGLLSCLFGPIAGSHHDMHVWHSSELEDFMLTHLTTYCVYGDKGYTSIGHLIGPIQHLPSLLEKQLNDQMMLLRVSVEHGFMRVSQLWPYFSKHCVLKTGATPLGAYYEVAAFLTNLRTCLDGGNQISIRFNCATCSVLKYLEKE